MPDRLDQRLRSVHLEVCDLHRGAIRGGEVGPAHADPAGERGVGKGRAYLATADGTEVQVTDL